MNEIARRAKIVDGDERKPSLWNQHRIDFGQLPQGIREMSKSDLNNIYTTPPRTIPPPSSSSLFNGQPKLRQYCPWYASRIGIWPVQSKPSGWMPKLMKVLSERFCDALKQHSQVLIVRFDLHIPQFTLDNAQISEFMSKLTCWIKKRYKGVNEVRYVWVRELEKAKQQHYHVVLILNGNKIRNPYYVHEKGREIWTELRGTSYHFSKHHHFHRDNHDSICEAFYYISYLAKARGKGYKPQRTKNYGANKIW